MTIIDPLQPAPKSRAPEVRNAYRFLKGAHDSVVALFDVSQTLSSARRASNVGRQGRMNTQEIDLLRAAIVFTASGLDASMSRLVNDAGRYLITRPESAARAQYEEFLKAEISKPQVSSGMKSAITSADPAGQMVDYYFAVRTKASFQGSEELKRRVRNTLGIPRNRLSDSRIISSDIFFIARNAIVHSMDYVEENDSGKTK